MNALRRSPLPCIRPIVDSNNTVLEQLSVRFGTWDSLDLPWSTITERDRSLNCLNVNVTANTINRALRDNAYIRPICTELEIDWYGGMDKPRQLFSPKVITSRGIYAVNDSNYALRQATAAQTIASQLAA